MGKNFRQASGPIVYVTLFRSLTIRAATNPDPIRIPTRVQELLAYLALNPEREIRRSHLAEVLWGSRRQAQSRKHLRQALWSLRSGIAKIAPGCEPVRCQGEWVRASLDRPIEIDIRAFERLTQADGTGRGDTLDANRIAEMSRAIELYTSDLLEDWDHDWCRGPREQLRRRVLTVLDRLLERALASSDDPRLVQLAARALEIDPARESAHRAMMTSSARAGDRSSAIRQYRICEQALRTELGVGPESRTRALLEELRET